jgi:16S rRNA (uracil1498-N3)-methyltransferase
VASFQAWHCKEERGITDDVAHERRVFLDHITDESEITVSENDAHHLRDVLRLTPGAHLTVVDKESRTEWDAVIAALKPEVCIKLLNRMKNAVGNTSAVKSLIFALGKNPVNDLVCEKAAELGVEHLIFWQAERSLLSLSRADAPAKVSRWSKIAESAAKQSGKNYVADVSVVLSLRDLKEKLHAVVSQGERLFCCSLASSALSLGSIVPLVAPVHMLVGPAGDLTAAEEQGLQELGFALLSLGPNLLRSETAAIAGIGMLQALRELSLSSTN